MTDVVERVFLVFGWQRAPRPVGASVGLGEFHAQQAPRELGIADLRGVTGERGRDLCVEHGAHQSNGRQHHLEILPRGVHDLDDVGRAHRGNERGEVRQGDGIDAHRIAVDRDLHQAQFGAVGLFAHEFRIERECGCAQGLVGKRGERIGGVDHQGLGTPGDVYNPEHIMLGNLRALFGVLIDIALLRRGPESLPTSTALMAGAIAFNLAVSALMTAMMPSAPHTWPIQLVIGTVVTLLWFDVAFRITKKRERFVQTITALFAVSALFLPALMPLAGALLPHLEKQDPATPPPFALSIVTAVIAVWMLIVQVRIVRAAYEWPYFVSIIFLFGQNIAGAVIYWLVFGVPTKAV